jgi:signal transduction histidine kinase
VAIAEAYPGADGATGRRLLELAGAAVASIEWLLGDDALVSLDPERLDAGRLAVEVAETAALGGARVVAETEGGLEVEGDPERLRQALVNLVANAVYHSPPGSTVTVMARRDGATVLISVTDQGEGIAAEDLARVFEPGVRLTTTRPGSGLGLAIARAVAREHGGEVAVESIPGRGSTFTLVLPGVSSAD